MHAVARILVFMPARFVLAVVLSCIAPGAQAHVTLWPRESDVGEWEKYVVRVPTEGKVATAAVELQIPDDVHVVSMGAAEGLRYELKRSADRVVAIVWTKQIAPGEFAEFAFMARNPAAAGDLVWKAVQHFADGSRTSWIGPAGDPHPASVTRVIAAKTP
jgi:uncharacterized protein YcnI